MTKKITYIVRTGSGGFLNENGKTVSEYPDAIKTKSFKHAKQMAEEYCKRSGIPATVIDGYGFKERVCYRADPNATTM